MQIMRMVGVEFENCPSCTGVWLDQGELSTLTRSRGGSALKVTVLKDKRTEYLCPKCQPASMLYEGKHNLDEEFLLDVCTSCAGIWFDRGEFPSLLQNRNHS
jgi:Zn-finger nucleic acid-binding protein